MQGGGVVDEEHDHDEGPREEEPNRTQEQMGEGEDKPADVSWSEDSFGEQPEG